MTAQTMTTMFAIVIVGGFVGLLAAFLNDNVRAWMQPSALGIAALVAVAAMLGSLYLSDVANFVPCRLCWFQRIAMYPLAVILVIAAVRQDHDVRWYALPLAVIGAAISAYHVQIQLFPEQSTMCEVENPCTAKWTEAFGFMTIPQMAGLCFLLVILTLVLFGGQASDDSDSEGVGSDLAG